MVILIASEVNRSEYREALGASKAMKKDNQLLLVAPWPRPSQNQANSLFFGLWEKSFERQNTSGIPPFLSQCILGHVCSKVNLVVKILKTIYAQESKKLN